MVEEQFIERRFELGQGELCVRFFTPSQAPGGEYQCHYCVQWPDREVRRYACGIDGIQALLLAMRTVHSDLLESETYKAGQLTWCNQSDLDLPPSWGAGPLYDPPPEP